MTEVSKVGQHDEGEQIKKGNVRHKKRYVNIINTMVVIINIAQH